MASSNQRYIAAVGDNVLSSTFSCISRWRLQSPFPPVSIQLQPQGSSLGSVVLQSHLLLPPGVEWKRGGWWEVWKGRVESPALGMSSCRESGRGEGSPRPRHHLASLGTKTFPGVFSVTYLDPVDWSHAENRELEDTGHSS